MTLRGACLGCPRIIINKTNILRLMKMVDTPHNGVTFCSGSYGTNLENDLPDMIRSLKGRIHFCPCPQSEIPFTHKF